MGTQWSFVGPLFIVSCVGFASVAWAQDKTATKAGEREYRMSCAVCHGVDARGEGPMAGVLVAKPSDLTLLSRKNHGVFPFLKVFQMIDGRGQTNSHGTREMPIWGNRYRATAGETYGRYGAETIVRGRILELVEYLQTIQVR